MSTYSRNDLDFDRTRTLSYPAIGRQPNCFHSQKFIAEQLVDNQLLVFSSAVVNSFQTRSQAVATIADRTTSHSGVDKQGA